jgi:hypothetical protein
VCAVDVMLHACASAWPPAVVKCGAKPATFCFIAQKDVSPINGVILRNRNLHDICSKIMFKEIYNFAFDMVFGDLLGTRYGFQNSKFKNSKTDEVRHQRDRGRL